MAPSGLATSRHERRRRARQAQRGQELAMSEASTSGRTTYTCHHPSNTGWVCWLMDDRARNACEPAATCATVIGMAFATWATKCVSRSERAHLFEVEVGYLSEGAVHRLESEHSWPARQCEEVLE
eukprot:2503589-Prymnesium_polylepis.3